MKSPIFRLMGDRALIVSLGTGLDPEINHDLRRLLAALDHHRASGIIDLIPAYSSLTIIYDPLIIDPEHLIDQIEDLWPRLEQLSLPPAKTIDIPVIYGGTYGPDLEWVADRCGLSPREVIRIHTDATYLVYMIGFTPGFPYMGLVPEAIAVPRLDSPRIRVPRGSVALAQRQTGIYPVESPGGWRIIGWTPLTLFAPHERPPSLLSMGDQVKFVPVTEPEALTWP
ncbi:MAG: 5-oxoprolinase subunit PxpB [Deltaproteobacteria bacterium]|nr:5-oxoprolinase subunit PxpB [Deltaproteobacteria bacterium]